LPVVAVVNRKGGSGKSTLATHLAAYLARRGTPVMLGDVDRQQSTVPWLRRRAARALPGAPIVGWAVDPRNVRRPPTGVAHVVLDTPGGLRGFDLSRLLMHVDAVLMPVGDSAFDREAAAACLAELRAHPRVASGRVRVAAVGVRIDARTRAEQGLREWAARRELTFLGVLRTAQAYVRCVDLGLTVFDLPEPAAQLDRAQWQPVLEWLAPVFDAPVPVPALQPLRPVTTVTTARPRPVTRPSTHQDEVPARAPSAIPTRPMRPAVARGPWLGMRRLLGWLAPQLRSQRGAL